MVENVHITPAGVEKVPQTRSSVISRVVDEAAMALSAEAVGCFKRMQDNTLDDLNWCQQSGGKIGTFQGLQHQGSGRGCQTGPVAFGGHVRIDDARGPEHKRASAPEVVLTRCSTAFPGRPRTSIESPKAPAHLQDFLASVLILPSLVFDRPLQSPRSCTEGHQPADRLRRVAARLDRRRAAGCFEEGNNNKWLTSLQPGARPPSWNPRSIRSKLANASDWETLRLMGKVFEALRDDRDLRVSMLMSSSDNYCCARWDLKLAPASDAPSSQRRQQEPSRPQFRRSRELRDVKTLVIACFNGLGFGGGFEKVPALLPKSAIWSEREGIVSAKTHKKGEHDI